MEEGLPGDVVGRKQHELAGGALQVRVDPSGLHGSLAAACCKEPSAASPSCCHHHAAHLRQPLEGGSVWVGGQQGSRARAARPPPRTLCWGSWRWRPPTTPAHCVLADRVGPHDVGASRVRAARVAADEVCKGRAPSSVTCCRGLSCRRVDVKRAPNQLACDSPVTRRLRPALLCRGGQWETLSAAARVAPAGGSADRRWRHNQAHPDSCQASSAEFQAPEAFQAAPWATRTVQSSQTARMVSRAGCKQQTQARGRCSPSRKPPGVAAHAMCASLCLHPLCYR